MACGNTVDCVSKLIIGKLRFLNEFMTFMKYLDECKLNRANIMPSKLDVYFQLVPNEQGEHVLLFTTSKTNKVSKFTEIIYNTINLVKVDKVKSE